MKHKLFINGEWVEGGKATTVVNKYTQEPMGTLPEARTEDVDQALSAAARTAPVMAKMPAHKRAEILSKAAQLLQQRRDEIAKTIALEAGKAIKFSRGEVDRATNTFATAAEEARRIHGETVPLDAVPSGEEHFGFWIRRPVGVVAAITPFNFPLNLVAHKIAPAIAAGNTIVLKPANTTPLTSVMLCQILQEAGMPAGTVNLVHGPGSTVGAQLVKDPRVAKITFTGSRAVGRGILAEAGIKKVTLELGNTAPVIIAPDADLEQAAKRCAVGAYAYSGQICISVQRVYADKRIREPFLHNFLKATESMVVGNPLEDAVDVGPMIDEREAVRVESWVKEAQAAGATVLTGGKRQGPVYWPTALTNVNPSMKVVAEEVFGPVASVIEFDDFEHALEQADNSQYALQAAVFTRDIDRVFRAMDKLNFGGIVINDSPTFRADHMPYGGNRQSGLGREGVRFAIEEMTNIQMVSIRRGARS
ncbi:MAG: aldehyde dehydrogenase family protein [Kofleriaceae bacterium]